MSTYPDNLKYAATHEWVRLEGDGTATVGISNHAQDALGDIVFVELPEVGATIHAKDEVAVVESVKAASDVTAQYLVKLSLPMPHSPMPRKPPTPCPTTAVGSIKFRLVTS